MDKNHEIKLALINEEIQEKVTLKFCDAFCNSRFPRQLHTHFCFTYGIRNRFCLFIVFFFETRLLKKRNHCL